MWQGPTVRQPHHGCLVSMPPPPTPHNTGSHTPEELGAAGQDPDQVHGCCSLFLLPVRGKGGRDAGQGPRLLHHTTLGLLIRAQLAQQAQGVGLEAGWRWKA